MINHKGGRLLGLHQLVALHATGCVDNKYDILGHHLIHFHTGRCQQKEEAVLACLAIAEYVEADLFRGHCIVEYIICIGRHIAGFIAHNGPALSFAANGYRVAGRVNGTDCLP